MTDLQLFESLCDIISRQTVLIRELVTQIREADALTEETEDKLFELQVEYEAITGDSDL